MKLQRMCVVCKEKRHQADLIRVAKTENKVFVDFENKLPGRGAYICKNKDCIMSARKRKTFERSFSAKVDPVIYNILEESFGDDQ